MELMGKCKIVCDLSSLVNLLLVIVIFGSGSNILHAESLTPNSTSTKPGQEWNPKWIYITAALSAILALMVLACFAALCYIMRDSDSKNEEECPWNNVFSLDKNSCCQGDQALATSVQRYHFTHQKQQMLTDNKRVSTRDSTDGQKDLVYECSGASAPINLEVENPGFKPIPNHDPVAENTNNINTNNIPKEVNPNSTP